MEAREAEDVPEGWEVAVSSSTGDVYYVHTEIGHSQYESPAVHTEQVLPEGWSRETSRTDGATYYYNSLTGESTFDFPSEPAVELGGDGEGGEGGGDDDT